MRVEICRMVADWLQADLAGQIAAVPRLAGIDLPATPTIFDESRHGFVARNSESDVVPAVVVSVDRIQYDGEAMTAGTRYADVTVLLRYYTKTRVETERVVEETSVMSRALLRSLSALRRQTVARVRNGIHLGAGFGAIEEGGVFAPEGDTPVTVGLLVTFSRCADTLTY